MRAGLTIWDEPSPSAADASGREFVSVASEGELVAGRYRLRRPIERGGMAEVWEGHDENLDRAVAIKMLHGHLSGDAGFVSRFRREALSIAKLSHPNVVAIFDTGVDQVPPTPGSTVGTTRAYIVMELIRGESLRAMLQKGVPMAKAVDIIRQAADGLAYAHRNGLVHRDVKPGNILVQADGRVKVVDFGIAKLTDRRVDDTDASAWTDPASHPGEDLTQVGAILGTAKYLAPEQVEGGVIDARSDVYALGVVLYEGVCGRPPFLGRNDLATAMKHVRETPERPRQIRPGIPRSLESVIVKAMSRRPTDRYPSADELASALRGIDLTPDDAEPAVSRTAADVTPSSPLKRADLPPVGAPGPGRRPFDDNTSEAVQRRAGTDRTTMTPSDARAGSTALRPDAAGRGGDAGADDGGSDPTRVQPARPPHVPPGAPRRFDRRRLLIPVIALCGLVLGGATSWAVASLRGGPGLDRTAATAYDPFGDDGQENSELARNVIDGDAGTTWRTSGYRERNFNGAKPGVGIVVQLAKPSSVGHLRVVSPSRGWSAKVYVADEIPADFSGWGAPTGSIADVTQRSTTVALTKKRGSRVLLWITRLSPKAASQEFTRVIVQEIAPRS